MQIQLDELDNIDEFWSQLFRVISNSYSLDYVKYKGKNYFNCTNMWYEASDILGKYDGDVKFCHKDHECGGYSDCDNCSKYNKRKVNSNEIKYFFSGKFSTSELAVDEDDLTDTINKKILEIEKYASTIDGISVLKSIKFVSEKNVIVINQCGFNKDHRGSDHTLIKLPFETKIVLGNEFSLEDIVVSFTNLKSHKFDGWYELYCGAKCKINQDDMIMELNLDHGS
jgi:hypothetical protein